MTKITKYRKTGLFLGIFLFAAVLFGAGAADAYTFTQYMRLGSRGPEVVQLQAALNAGGYAVPPLVQDGIFGPKTRAAVVAFQSAKGLVPDGIVGPITRAALNAGVVVVVPPPANGCLPGWVFNPLTGARCGTTPPPSSPDNDGDLEGGAGSITVSGLSTYSSEEVGEGEEDERVLAFEIEADDESDVRIDSVRVELNQSTTADSEDLEDYAEEISVWMGNDEVGRVDAEEFSDSSTTDVWVKTISLDDNAIVRAGETEKFSIAVSALSSLDSGDIDSDDWQIGVSSIRFTDADGVTTTESLALDIDDDVVDDEVEQDFDFASFASATDLELSIALNDDEINDARTIDIDDTDDTDNVKLLSFTIDVEGADITLDEIPVNFDTVGVNIGDAVSEVSLLMDGEEIGSETLDDADTDETATFDNLDLELKEGESYDFTVEANLKSLADGIANGDTIRAQITSTERDLIQAEDESGEDVGTADMTGTAVADAHAMFDAGIRVVFDDSSYVRTTSSTSGIDETVEFTLEFDVTAYGDDIWIDKTCAFDDDGTYPATQLSVSLDGDADGDNTTCTDFDSTGDEGTNGFEVQEGTTEHFTVTILGDAGEAGGAGQSVTFQARINNIGFNVGTDAEGDTSYNLNLDEFESASVTVFDR